MERPKQQGNGTGWSARPRSFRAYSLNSTAKSFFPVNSTIWKSWISWWAKDWWRNQPRKEYPSRSIFKRDHSNIWSSKLSTLTKVIKIVPAQLNKAPKYPTKEKKIASTKRNRVKHACLHQTGLITMTLSEESLFKRLFPQSDHTSGWSKRTECGKENGVANIGRLGQKNDQSIDPHTHTTSRGHSVFQCE